MKFFNFVRAGMLAIAAIGALALAPTPSFAGTTNLGERTQVIDKSDKVTRREAVATSAPVVGQPSITVTETVHYLNSPWQPWKNNQTYYVKTTVTAEYVDRLGYWMLKDPRGVLFKFTPGSIAGTETLRPTVDIGLQTTVLSQTDSATIGGVSAGVVTPDGSSRSLEVKTLYRHAETYNDVTYAVISSVSAPLVREQSAHMAWIGNRLYKADSITGKLEMLAGKPSANVGVRNGLISQKDRSISWEPSVSAGQISVNGRTRTLIVSRDYQHEETYQNLIYSIQEVETAVYVPEQNGYMEWIGNRLYKVRIGSDVVQQLATKPTVNLGQRNWKEDFNDQVSSVSVTPRELTTDRKSVVVNVRRNYQHVEHFQVKEYYLESREVAVYNAQYKVWTVTIEGRVYAVLFANDTVSDPNVIVIKAPSDLKRPDVIVVNPGNGNAGDPPVVVPGKPKPKAPPVVDNDDPPVVVPGKRTPPRNVPADDDVVVPRRR